MIIQLQLCEFITYIYLDALYKLQMVIYCFMLHSGKQVMMLVFIFYL